eukprot:Rmarinus@m.10000
MADPLADQSEALKVQANTCFGKGKLDAAIDLYTEAICFNPSYTACFMNRGICYFKTERYPSAISDCLKVLELDPTYLKAYFYLGRAQIASNTPEEAVETLRTGLSKSVVQKKFHAELQKALHDALYARWVQRRDKHHIGLASLKEELAKELEFARTVRAASGDESSDAVCRERIERVNELFKHCAAVSQVGQDIPDYLLCNITLDIMVDPVSGPSGHTYERAAIEEHLRKNGNFDPITRSPMTIQSLRPNLAVMQALEHYMEQKLPYFS